MIPTSSLRRPVALAGFVALVGCLVSPTTALAQGCMATRVSPPMLGVNGSSRYLQQGQMEASFAFRYYYAERHFYDSNDEVVPANAPRVKRTTYDLSLTRMLTARDSLTVSIPYQQGSFDRSPIPPFNGSTDRASGIGDVAVTFRRWIFDTTVHTKYNLRLGLGVKLPTGKDDVKTDRLVNLAPRGTPANFQWRRGPADVAIQPGDGGWGIILGAEGFHELGAKSLLYGEVTYLANPRGHNGVNNQWGGPGP
ncbi:MAG TPA: hypothetical protein VEQ65_12130, partial [Opitutus sp.]|nr:hypothetical protein [Opitutus sp.]